MEIKSEPKVSIIMPTYNCARYIRQAVASVLAQTEPAWELWIIDDASDDGTEVVLSDILAAEPRIHYLRIPARLGAAAARNQGIERAAGDYIAFLDSDDVWYSHKLKRQLEFMESRNSAFCATCFDVIDAEGRYLREGMKPPERMDYAACIYLSNPLNNSSVIYSRRLLGRVFVPQIERRNDFALWLRILKLTPYCECMEEVLSAYRTGRKEALSARKWRLAHYHWELYRSIEGHSIVRSLRELGYWIWRKGLCGKTITGKSLIGKSLCGKTTTAESSAKTKNGQHEPEFLGVSGRFAFGKRQLNGQTIKTQMLTDFLCQAFPTETVLRMDTYGGLPALPRMLWQSRNLLRSCKNILMLPSYKGLRVLVPWCLLLNCLYHRKLYYIVIGGWLPDFLRNRPLLRYLLKRLDCVCVETRVMLEKLRAQGFERLMLLPNCKQLKPLERVAERGHMEDGGKPLRLCIFSRITAMKGIELAIQAVTALGQQVDTPPFCLDIYGQLEKGFEKRFAKLRADFPPYIRYCGVGAPDKSVELLRDYDALLFPTCYMKEGLPGTVLDAYAAALPVIAARWESFAELIEENVTGLGFERGNEAELEAVLRRVAGQPQLLWEMKQSCLDRAAQYVPERALVPLLHCLSASAR